MIRTESSVVRFGIMRSAIPMRRTIFAMRRIEARKPQR
jgi:hypothetical protein